MTSCEHVDRRHTLATAKYQFVKRNLDYLQDKKNIDFPRELTWSTLTLCRRYTAK